jgi:hypothetical protein
LTYDSQARPAGRGGTDLIAYPEFAQFDLAYKFKTWFYMSCIESARQGENSAEQLVESIKAVADHWCGDHSRCSRSNPSMRCVTQQWSPNRKFLTKGSAAYQALVTWLDRNITVGKMKFYVRARENYLSETFHSLINKYATKRIHWKASHQARLACAALDWNENRFRECLRVDMRKPSHSAVRRRPRRQRVLTEKTYNWKKDLEIILFGDSSTG